MTRIVIVRPGLTSFDEQGRLIGRLDIPLSSSGLQQARCMASQLANLDIQCVYCAPCRRSIQTAEHIASVLGVRVVRLRKLRNLDLGLWEGRQVDEIRRMQPRVFRMWQDQPEALRPPEGETIDEARTRIRRSLHRLVRDRAVAVALIVPEPLASIAGEMLFGRSLRNPWKSICGEWGIWGSGETVDCTVASLT